MAKIFVKTGNFNNKGDMLMLFAVVQRYGDKHEISVLPSSCSKGTAEKLGVLFCQPYSTNSKKAPGVFFKSLMKRFFNALPDSLLKGFGYVSPRNISLVLDASGFAYGEYWGPEKINNAVKTYASFKGACVVFLPQSYGPFESQCSKGCMRDLVHSSPMICARDRSSYEHIAPLVPDSSSFYCSPDFTFDVERKEPVDLLLPKEYVLLIPSHRVADSVGHELFWSFYKHAFEAVTKFDCEVVILAHDTKHDFHIAERLRTFLGVEKPTVALDDVREIRWVISKSTLVIGSRFHGLVNALSQGVPAVGLGWTHKFDCLFEDYGVKEFLAKEEGGFKGVFKVINDLLDVEKQGKREALLSTMGNNRRILLDKADLMWTRLDDIVDRA